MILLRPPHFTTIPMDFDLLRPSDGSFSSFTYCLPSGMLDASSAEFFIQDNDLWVPVASLSAPPPGRLAALDWG